MLYMNYFTSLCVKGGIYLSRLPQPVTLALTNPAPLESTWLGKRPRPTAGRPVRSCTAVCVSRAEKSEKEGSGRAARSRCVIKRRSTRVCWAGRAGSALSPALWRRITSAQSPVSPPPPPAPHLLCACVCLAVFLSSLPVTYPYSRFIPTLSLCLPPQPPTPTAHRPSLAPPPPPLSLFCSSTALLNLVHMIASLTFTSSRRESVFQLRGFLRCCVRHQMTYVRCCVGRKTSGDLRCCVGRKTSGDLFTVLCWA